MAESQESKLEASVRRRNRPPGLTIPVEYDDFGADDGDDEDETATSSTGASTTPSTSRTSRTTPGTTPVPDITSGVQVKEILEDYIRNQLSPPPNHPVEEWKVWKESMLSTINQLIVRICQYKSDYLESAEFVTLTGDSFEDLIESTNETCQRYCITNYIDELKIELERVLVEAAGNEKT